jgi:hypothetical protein
MRLCSGVGRGVPGMTTTEFPTPSNATLARAIPQRMRNAARALECKYYPPTRGMLEESFRQGGLPRQLPPRVDRR